MKIVLLWGWGHWSAWFFFPLKCKAHYHPPLNPSWDFIFLSEMLQPFLSIMGLSQKTALWQIRRVRTFPLHKRTAPACITYQPAAQAGASCRHKGRQRQGKVLQVLISRSCLFIRGNRLLTSGNVQARPRRGRQRLSRLHVQFVVFWVSTGLNWLLMQPVMVTITSPYKCFIVCLK